MLPSKLLLRSVCIASLCTAFGTAPALAGPNAYLGEIVVTASTYCPRGTVSANGQLLSIAENTALYSLLGVTYGGDGVETFALPNLQGRVPVGQGAGPGLNPVRLGQAFGSDTHVLTENEMPAHTHAAVSTAASDLFAVSEPGDTGNPDGAALAQVTLEPATPAPPPPPPEQGAVILERVGPDDLDAAALAGAAPMSGPTVILAADDPVDPGAGPKSDADPVLPLADADPVDPDAAPVADADPVDPDATPVADADSVDPDATPVADADPVDPDATPVADADPVDPDATPVADADPVDPDAAPVADADPVDPDVAPVADADPVDPNAAATAAPAVGDIDAPEPAQPVVTDLPPPPPPLPPLPVPPPPLPDVLAFSEKGALNSILAPGSVETLVETSISPAGGGAAFNITQPSLVIRYCIATVGAFPSRD